jgi:hypothetical protein
MLQHSRSSNGKKEPTDINALADEYLRLSLPRIEGKRQIISMPILNWKPMKSFPKINVIPQDIGRVLLNLINNAFYAVSPCPPKGGSKSQIKPCQDRNDSILQTHFIHPLKTWGPD